MTLSKVISSVQSSHEQIRDENGSKYLHAATGEFLSISAYSS
jgi:hypothetical protein